VKYGFMQRHTGEFRVMAMCRVLQVSRSGDDVWQRRPPSVRTQTNQRLMERMRVLHQQTREAYGARKMWRLLTREGLVCGRHRVARLRRVAGSVALRRRRYVRTGAGAPARDAGHSQSPQPTVCRVGEESGVDGRSHVRPDAHGLAHSGGVTGSLFPAHRGVGHESKPCRW
jgi:hypothetical protein